MPRCHASAKALSFKFASAYVELSCTSLCSLPKMARPHRPRTKGRARTQRNRRRRVARRMQTTRREITPSASECRAKGLAVYRSSLAPVPVEKPTSVELHYYPEIWVRKIASPSVLKAMISERRYGVLSAHSDWSRGDECFGDHFEYCFRRKYPIPIHIPRRAMKAIVLYAVSDPEMFGEENPPES